MSDKLFANRNFRDYTDLVFKNAASRIERLTKNDFDGSSVVELADKLYQDFSISTPALLVENIFQRKPIDKIISTNRGQAKGTQFTFVIPYLGTSELFHCTPSRFNYNPPYGKLSNEGIICIYEVVSGHDPSPIKGLFDQNIDNIQKWLNNLDSDIQAFNNVLKRDLSIAIQNRKDKLDRDDEVANSFGFPIK